MRKNCISERFRSTKIPLKNCFQFLKIILVYAAGIFFRLHEQQHIENVLAESPLRRYL